LRQAFSESRSVAILEQHMPYSVSYINFLANIEKLLDVNGEPALLRMRETFSAADYVNLLFDDVSIGGFVVDDGFAPANHITLANFADLVQRPVFRCRRIENALEEGLLQCDTFEAFEAKLPQLLLGEPGTQIVALKTIAAYRGGLDVELVSRQDAKSDFQSTRNGCVKNNKVRITRSPFYHYMLGQCFLLAEENQLPVQIHCGLGDQDQDLSSSNPLCMRKVLQSTQYRKTKFVLLHSFPFVREAATLTSLYANVFMDISLSTFIAAPSVEGSFFDALSIAPVSKILASTDGHSVPETYWYSALKIRDGLARALQALIDKEFLNAERASQLAAMILHDNARTLYQLKGLI